MPVSSSTEHWIKPDALTINLNHFGDPDYLQVSVLAGAVVMAFKQDVIGYNAAHNYRTWPLEAANTYLENSSAVNVYAKLTRSEVNARALIAYDTVLRDIEGREITYAEDGSEILGEPNPDLYYIFLGKISSSIGSSGQSEQREWTIGFKTGNLDTNQYQNEEAGGEWTKMFRLNKMTDMIDVLKTFSSAIFKKLFIDKKAVTDVAVKVEVDEASKVSDTILASTAWVTATVEDRYLRKDKDDRSTGTIASDKGFEVGDFNEGTLGSGAATFMRDGSSYSEVDFLKVRKKATFTEITVQELKHVGGEIILSPAAMICSRVEESENGWKCYFNTEDSEGRKVYQEFEPNDLARCQTFNLSPKGANDLAGNHYYWRKVVSVGDDYIELSKAECDDQSDAPQVGDNISQLGNTSNTERQAAIILSAFGSDAPSYKQYNGIDGFSLVGKQVTKLSPYGNELTGILNIEAGSKGAGNLEDFPEEIFKAVHIGSVNLLLNSGFTGDYNSEDLDASYALSDKSELFSRGMKHWNGTATINDDAASVSGKSATIESLSQSVQLMKGEVYVVSFKAKGASVKVILGGASVENELTSEYMSYSFKFTSDGIGTFSISGDATICDLQLERGTIATDWHASPYDNDRTLAEFQALKYIQDAIREGDTTILGGLILSSMIQLGNYKNGKMEKVNAGMSGIYNDNDDVAFWGGGTFEQAIATVMKFKQNPNYQPTDAEWKDFANFVVSHGGDLFLRGTIFADNGYFRGEVNQGNGATLLSEDGSGHLSNGAISWNQYGVMYRKSYDVIVWRSIRDSSSVIDLNQGLYIDLASGGSVYTLPDALFDGIVLYVKFNQISRSDHCAILKGNFKARVRENGDIVWKPASRMILDVEDKEVALTYNLEQAAWVYDKKGVSIDEDGMMIIGEVVESETEVVADKVVSNSFVVGNNEGITRVIPVYENGGRSYFTFTSGILTAYRYEPNEE